MLSSYSPPYYARGWYVHAILIWARPETRWNFREIDNMEFQ